MVQAHTPANLTSKLFEPLAEKAEDAASNWAKIATAIHGAVWAPRHAGIVAMETVGRRDVATGIYLRRLIRYWRSLDQDTDEKRRFYLRMELLGRWAVDGGPANLLTALECLFEADFSLFEIVENEDVSTGEYAPAFYYVRIDPSAVLAPIGFASSEYTAVLTDVADWLDRISATGVGSAVVNVASGAGAYDSAIYGTDVYG